jgi:arsenate reductase
MGRPGLARRAFAEGIGTGLLVVAVVGSGIMAARLSPGDIGVQLLENSTATALALAVLILTFGPVSGAHLNPVVSIGDWWLGRANRTGLAARELAPQSRHKPADWVNARAGCALATTPTCCSSTATRPSTSRPSSGSWPSWHVEGR